MRDSHVLQFSGMIVGIASVAFPYLALSFSSDSSTAILFYISICIAFFIALIGLVLSIIGIVKARANGDNKVKAVIGLITSIVGITTCLCLVLLVGMILAIALTM